MDKEIINSYIINVRRFIAPFLKPNVSIRFIVYPFSGGAVIVGEFGLNANNNTEFKSESPTINDAIAKTNLFDKPNDLQPIQNTKIILGNGTIVIIKGECASWSEKDAEEDVRRILSSMSKN